MYKYLLDPSTGLNRTDAICRISDSATIPNDIYNYDWLAYQEWIALGNTPDPA